MRGNVGGGGSGQAGLFGGCLRAVLREPQDGIVSGMGSVGNRWLCWLSPSTSPSPQGEGITGGGQGGLCRYAGLNARRVRLIRDARHSSVPSVLLRFSRISMSAKPASSTIAR